MEEIGIDMLMLFYYTAVAIIRGSFRSVQLGGRRQQVYLFSKLFGDRLMVGQQVLVLFIGVRVPVPEHCRTKHKKALFLFKFRYILGSEMIVKSLKSAYLK